MNEHIRVAHAEGFLLPTDVEGFESLAELALESHWTWNHAPDQLWQPLDPVLWELTQNPWSIRQTLSWEKYQRVLAEPAFRKCIDDMEQARRDAAETPVWFQQTHPHTQLRCVACFSMEIILSEVLPIYSGRPGNVAVDPGVPELRLKQELLPGIGGWQPLTAPGIQPKACYLYEGHVAPAVPGRACSFMLANGPPFEAALTVTRAGNLCSTHTALVAGLDRFGPAFIDRPWVDMPSSSSALHTTLCRHWAAGS